MPIHMKALDVVDKLERPGSALIIPCYMCPAVTAAITENKPFLQLFSHFLKSPPFERSIKTLQARLEEHGVSSTVFKSHFMHQWFLCMWTSGRRKKLMRQVGRYDYLIVLGCDSATETVRDLVKTDNGKVVQGMEVTGFMNARMRVHLPGDVSLEDCKIIPLPQQTTERDNEMTFH